ncbi:MAG: ABC transporter permease [Chloroflexi bacterium]|nr:ABC transporter permease [Chloroflexota bacterium]
MTRFIVRRLIQAALTLVGVTMLTFALVRLAPGDPVSLMLAGSGDLSAEDIAALRAAYGVDEPIPQQYVRWVGRVAQGDLGSSLLSKRPVGQMIASALPNTLQLSLAALAVALLVGVPLGVTAALRRGTWVDQVIRVLSVGGHAVPPFWLGLLFILTLSVQLRLFPVGGMLSVGAGEWDVGDRLLHLVGPVLTLSLAGIANYTRYLRTEVLDVLAQDHVRTARSKGLPDGGVVWRHVLRNALTPVITALGGVLAAMVSGALVVEQVFAWPGMGRLAFEAARGKDYPVIMGVVLLTSALLLVSYLLRDILYSVADPRVGHE